MSCRSRASGALSLVLLVSLLASGCASHRLRRAQPAIRKLTATSYYNEGRELFFGVDLRAARFAGPQEFLPLFLSVMNKTSDRIVVTRESFRLELPDGTTVPLVPYEEFSSDYHRSRSDVRIAREYMDALNGRFPVPPFGRLALDFFPVKNSPTVPRDRIELFPAQVVTGYLYFRLPKPSTGPFKLLMTPAESGETYVLPIDPFGS